MKHGRPAQNDGMSARDSWCTPAWITNAIGKWDLDPCSNDRSNVRALTRFSLVDGDDGLALAATVEPERRVFINPPYSLGQVIRWVRAYAHTRFCFLLRFDPSTAWHCELYQHTSLVAIPHGRRVNFEPPPGVRASSSVFPHALYFRDASDATPEVLRSCIAWRTR